MSVAAQKSLVEKFLQFELEKQSKNPYYATFRQLFKNAMYDLNIWNIPLAKNVEKNVQSIWRLIWITKNPQHAQNLTSE